MRPSDVLCARAHVPSLSPSPALSLARARTHTYECAHTHMSAHAPDGDVGQWLIAATGTDLGALGRNHV